MAINKPILAAGPASQLRRVPDISVPTHPVKPGETYRTLIDDVPTDITVDPPTREGQVYFRIYPFFGTKRAMMYVGVLYESSLVWAAVSFGNIVNSYTNQPFDPIYDQ